MKNFDVFFWNGINSKFPLCCIFWFLSGWQNYGFEKKKKEWFDYGDGYIRCPECVARVLQ